MRNSMDLISRSSSFSKLIATTVCTDAIVGDIALEKSMNQVMQVLKEARSSGRTVYIVGNGGSAAVASHAITDFVNVAKLRAQVLHEPSLVTCMANDYGYENAYARLLETYAEPGDVLIAVSSSGQSKNICNAANVMKAKGSKVITFSGFSSTNPLRKLGYFNFWLDSTDYGFVEVGHQFILHNLSDRFGAEGQPSFQAKEAIVDFVS